MCAWLPIQLLAREQELITNDFCGCCPWQWVQCDRCRTWRIVPDAHWPAVEADTRDVRALPPFLLLLLASPCWVSLLNAHCPFQRCMHYPHAQRLWTCVATLGLPAVQCNVCVRHPPRGRVWLVHLQIADACGAVLLQDWFCEYAMWDVGKLTPFTPSCAH